MLPDGDDPVIASAQHAAGYGRVLPHESVKLLATFQPPIPGVQYFELTCRTLAGRQFRLEGRAEGLQPNVSLSHSVIKVSLRATLSDSTARVRHAQHVAHMTCTARAVHTCYTVVSNPK